jgi:hypothetical protein
MIPMDPVIHKACAGGSAVRKFDLVVAHYREDLGWLTRLDHEQLNNIFVYTKGEDEPAVSGAKIRRAKLPNVGRESHTYLWHCLEQYDDLANGSADFVFFVQGGPHGMDERRIPEWMEEVSRHNLRCTYNFMVSSPWGGLTAGRCPDWAGPTDPARYGLKPWCDAVVKRAGDLRYLPIFWNACFGVSVDRILSNPKAKYERIIREELSTVNPECGHFCERLWYYIFNLDEVKDSVFLDDCYSFWGDHQGETFRGIVKLNADGTVGLYKSPTEHSWAADGASITLRDRKGRPTSVLRRKREKQYLGRSLVEYGGMNRLVGLAVPPWNALAPPPEGPLRRLLYFVIGAITHRFS